MNKRTFLCCLLLLLTLPGFPYAQGLPSKTTNRSYIGNYSIGPYGTAEFKIRKNKGTTAVLTGQGENVVTAKSALYDIAAKRIEIAAATVNGKTKPSDLQAIGTVRIVIREPDQNRLTVITCERAVYVASKSAEAQGTLQLTGKVVAEMTDPNQLVPLRSESDTGNIVFLTDGNFDVRMGNGVITGQPVETATKPRGTKP